MKKNYVQIYRLIRHKLFPPGEAVVPVADCKEREYNSQKKTTFTLNKYLEYLENHIQDGHPPSKPNLYLKVM